jgi:flavorubredoxin
MRNVVLHASEHHQFILLNESGPGEEEGIRSNQYLVAHHGAGILLDPGGFGVMPSVLAELMRYTGPDGIRGIVLSHQDPDIVGGLATWLEITQGPVYVPRIWLRFLPHYGIRDIERFVGVPDEGMDLDVAEGFKLRLLPAHFLHSEGQINVYDPIAQALFTGDIGSAMLPPEAEHEFVDDFAPHLPHIEGFHRRYMGSNRAARLWVDSLEGLELRMLAPQHGPVYRGRAVPEFLGWFRELRCGIDLLQAGGRFQGGPCL